MLTLEVLSGPSAGLHQQFVEPEVTIGRGSTPSFRVADDDRFVGRGVHCRLKAAEATSSNRKFILSNEHAFPVIVRTGRVREAVEQGKSHRFESPAQLEFGKGAVQIAVTSAADPPESVTQSLLEQSWAGSDRAAERLLEEHMPWLHERARYELGDQLRRRVDSLDIMNEAAIRFVKYGPRHQVTKPEQFRALMYRIIKNTIVDQWRYHHAEHRDMDKEKALPAESQVGADPPRRLGESPSQEVARKERDEDLLLALDLLDANDSEVIRLHQLEGLTFPQIGEKLKLAPDTARRRYDRALPRLEETMRRLHKGEIDDSIGVF